MMRVYIQQLRKWRGVEVRTFKLKSFRHRVFRLVFALGVLVGLHTLAMMVFENLAPGDALWLTLTTLTTVGYGDYSAVSNYGRFATILLMYMAGILILAQLVGEYVDYRVEKHARMIQGNWRWEKMNNHILIINTPVENSDTYLALLVEQIQATPEFMGLPIELLTSHFPGGLPAGLREKGVVHRTGIAEHDEDLIIANIDKAKYILILAEHPQDRRSDSVTLDILEHIKSLKNKMTINGYVIAECVYQGNRQRFERMGANAVLRPVRAYPEILVRAMSAPGSEQILEDLFRYEGTHPHRYDFDFENIQWRDLACNILYGGFGTPVGYIGKGAEVVTNPAADDFVSGCAIIILVNQNKVPNQKDIHACIKPHLLASGS